MPSEFNNANDGSVQGALPSKRRRLETSGTEEIELAVPAHPPSKLDQLPLELLFEVINVFTGTACDPQADSYADLPLPRPLGPPAAGTDEQAMQRYPDESSLL